MDFETTPDPQKAQPSHLPHRFYKHPLHGTDYLRVVVNEGQYIYDQPVTDEDKIDFAEAWKAYEAGVDQAAGKTRLEDVAWLDDTYVSVLQDKGVFSVEQLAHMTEAHMDLIKVPHIRQMVDKAKQHVAEQSDVAEIDDLKARLAAMEAELAASKAAKDTAPAKPASPRKPAARAKKSS